MTLYILDSDSVYKASTGPYGLFGFKTLMLSLVAASRSAHYLIVDGLLSIPTEKQEIIH